MSDADNQLGGTGAERGPDPEEVVPSRDNAAPTPDDAPLSEDEQEDETDEDEPSRQSFPASDPPANY